MSHARATFTFLGTGTSAGVPAIGCDCAVCTSPDPRDARLRTAAALRFTDAAGKPRTVLLDAGPDLRQQSLRARLTRCDAVLFTHNHVDHTFGLDEVRRFNVVQSGPTEVWGEAHTLAHLRRVYAHIFERERNVNDSFVASLIAREITPREVNEGVSLDVFGLRVTPLRLLHGRLPILGYRVDAPGAGEATAGSSAADDLFPLAYCTDVSGIPPETWPRFRGVRTLVLDALRHRHHPTHLTIGQAVSIAHEIGAPRTYFVHMGHEVGHEATQGQLPEGMFLAYDGLELTA
ncbi:MAG: MBL fold metallo-hydrolase [Planctomycetota bacterium]|nr:MBL fold metallo-hydrolase [Planctomycetota bacterium]